MISSFERGGWVFVCVCVFLRGVFFCHKNRAHPLPPHTKALCVDEETLAGGPSRKHPHPSVQSVGGVGLNKQPNPNPILLLLSAALLASAATRHERTVLSAVFPFFSGRRGRRLSFLLHKKIHDLPPLPSLQKQSRACV